MNKYEKHLIDKREKLHPGLYQPRIHAFGGWDEAVCGVCALAAIIQIDRCDHVGTIVGGFLSRYTGCGGGFYSSNGSSLGYIQSTPVCGHTQGDTI